MILSYSPITSGNPRSLCDGGVPADAVLQDQQRASDLGIPLSASLNSFFRWCC